LWSHSQDGSHTRDNIAKAAAMKAFVKREHVASVITDEAVPHLPPWFLVNHKGRIVIVVEWAKRLLLSAALLRL
jgi:hypothetical protein